MRRWLSSAVLFFGCSSALPGASGAPDVQSADSASPEKPSANEPIEDEEVQAKSNRPAFRAHAVDVCDYTLRASLDPDAHVVKGSGRIRWKNTSAVAVREMFFHLYLNAFKNEASVFLRDPIGGFRGTGSVKTWGSIDVTKLVWKRPAGDRDLLSSFDVHSLDPTDETDARLTLGEDVDVGASVELEIEWDAKLPSVVERTGFSDSFHLVGQWFPKVAVLEKDGTWAHFPFHHLSEFYADFGTYDVTLDVPEAYVLGATGPVVSAARENGRRVERHVQSDIHDFAWTAWDQWQERRETIEGIDVRLLYPPGYAHVGERDLAALRFAIPHYRDRYGPYPYPVLTVVHPRERDSEAGGMEYPTFITTTGPWWGPPAVPVPELVTIHEFGHQYFYGLLASNEARYPFLDEGFNSYAEAHALTGYLGTGSVFDAFGVRISGFSIQGATSRRAALTESVARGAGEFATGSDYGALVYQRTAALLETIGRVYGKEQMVDAMRRYAAEFRFRHPTPEDMLASMDRSLGPVARAALEEGFLRRGWIDYEPILLDCGTPHEAAGIFDRKGTRETIPNDRPTTEPREVGVTLARRGTIVLPVEVELTFDDGSSHRLTWDGRGETARVGVVTNRALVSAHVDPDRRITIDDDYANNRRICRQRDKRRGGRLLALWAFVGELLANGVSP